MTTRRTVLKAVVASGAVAVFSGKLTGLSAFAAAAVPVRRSLHGMALDDPDLDTYRNFVGLMQGKDQTKPVSWLGYSLQHGTYNGNYKYCPHGDWYFLPWHRAYVVMYEAAARALTGNAKFAMPYWDWTLDRTMPAAFTDPTYKGKPNPLYVSTRTLTNPAHWPLPDSIVGPDIITSIYRETIFQLFGTSKNPAQNDLDMSWVVRGGGTQGTMERTPHNTIHNWIGGFMPTAGSPRDPIFMMHHSNLDRIWAYWNAMGRSNTSGMDPATQKLWLDMNFKDNYLKPDGTPYSMLSRDTQNTIALGYTYEGLPAADNRPVDTERAQRLMALFSSGETSQRVENLQVLPDTNTEAATLARPLVKTARLRPQMRDQVMAEASSGTRAPEVFALIKDMDVSPNVESVRVFVNAPDAGSNTPDSDPHFVTQISFLLHGEGGHHKQPPSTLVDLTATLRKLSKQNLLKDDTISVHVVPVLREGSPEADASVVPSTIEIAVL